MYVVCAHVYACVCVCVCVCVLTTLSSTAHSRTMRKKEDKQLKSFVFFRNKIQEQLQKV